MKSRVQIKLDAGLMPSREDIYRVCIVPGCGRDQHSHGLCVGHVARKRQDQPIWSPLQIKQGQSVNDAGYVVVNRLDHPLSDIRGRVYLHRAVLFDAIGWGPHACAECGCYVEWRLKGYRTNAISVDHIDFDKQNNSLPNLRPLCYDCNGRRHKTNISELSREGGNFPS